MSLSSHQIMNYLALLADPEQSRITRAAWTVVESEADLVWSGWAPDSVVAVESEPPAEWYDKPVIKTTPSPRAAGYSHTTTSPWALRHPVDAPNSLAEHFNPPPEPDYTPPRGPDTEAFRELARRDELHREEALGRAGWLFVAGTLDLGEERIPCCFPLFERRVKFTRVSDIWYPQWQGALQRNALLRRRVADTVEDPIDRFLRNGAGAANAHGIAEEVAALLGHYGLTITAATDGSANPATFHGQPDTVLIPGTGFYLARRRHESAPTNDLSRWTTRHVSDTAFAELYRTTDSVLHDTEHRISPIRCGLPLNDRQREAIDRLDTETVVAVSGPPGTGKTHMIVAAASDAVARGLSVLIATKSDFAAESTCELLDQFPTPPHVRFGKDEHRHQVADLLSSGSTAGISDEQLAALRLADDEAWATLESLGADVLRALDRKQRFEKARGNHHLPAAAGAPRVLEPGFPLDQLDRLIADAKGQPGRRQKRALSKLLKTVGAADNVPLERVEASIAGAKAERAIQAALEAARGTALDDLWAQLDRAESDAKASQAILDIALRSRPSPGALASVAALATALRSSLAGGSLQLEAETNAAFLHHLPFWVGTLDEIETTLPANPGMFDVVFFDEASQIDQMAAVPALCRAKRAFVVGDPQQLRHTSTITAQQIEAARIHAKLQPGDDAALLDIAANSLFDIAAAATPITWLDEHFRSVPHLIQFSSERWYGNNLRLMTQHPRNEDLDVIHPIRVHGHRSSAVNEHEVSAIIARLHQLHTAGPSGRSVGVITPFTEQAQALEDAVIDAFDYDAIRAMKLRVGTVRGVQGTERDTILVSLVLDDRDYETALPLVEDRHLFNVMATRARSQLDVFHSFDPATLPRGLLADWFHYEKNPPGLESRSSAPASAWTANLAEALELAGVRVVTRYPVAGWNVDLVVGEGDAAFGVETTVHPDGPEAHAKRHLTLRRAGWHLVSVFESSWLLKTEDAAIYLAGIASRRAQQPR